MVTKIQTIKIMSKNWGWIKGIFYFEYHRYSNESFIGKLDTTIYYEKCGAPAASYSGDVLGMRDAALGTIQASSDIYRVGVAGYVQAESQCIGDLDIKECSECVTVAVSQVRNACAYAGAGEVYLGKCYARYWANDGYNPSPSSPSSPSSPDDNGKLLTLISLHNWWFHFHISLVSWYKLNRVLKRLCHHVYIVCASSDRKATT